MGLSSICFHHFTILIVKYGEFFQGRSMPSRNRGILTTTAKPWLSMALILT